LFLNFASSLLLFITNFVANRGEIYVNSFQNLAATYILAIQSRAEISVTTCQLSRQIGSWILGHLRRIWSPFWKKYRNKKRPELSNIRQECSCHLAKTTESQLTTS